MKYLYNDKPNFFNIFIIWISNLLSVIIFALFFAELLCGQFCMIGSSMKDSVYDQQIVLIDKLSYQLGKPERFDIILFEDNEGNKSIKRIIGLPGETIQIKNNSIYVDGEVLNWKVGEIIISGLANEPVEVSEESYFLMGDNPSFSEDSRFENVGNVERSSIEGKVWFCIYPLSDVGKVD